LAQCDDATRAADAEKLLRQMRRAIFEFEAVAESVLVGKSLSSVDAYHSIYPKTCKAITEYMTQKSIITSGTNDLSEDTEYGDRTITGTKH